MANTAKSGSFLLVGALTAALGTVAATVAVAVPAQAGPLDCVSGYVWRNARDGDAVCVTPATRDTVAQQNANAGANKDPNGAYGPQSCAQGFVWREAFDGDTVCVTPDFRQQMWDANAAAPSRVAANAPAPAAPPAQNPLCGFQNPIGGGVLIPC
ncbi:MAG TPA: hypothetical protein VJR50_25955 [Mycobacterium sp.]|jgi:hypothetical protein|nr:hypothetical protein [Mycobacterium sp.]